MQITVHAHTHLYTYIHARICAHTYTQAQKYTRSAHVYPRLGPLYLCTYHMHTKTPKNDYKGYQLKATLLIFRIKNSKV